MSKFFLSTFSPNQRILSTFRFFQQQKNLKIRGGGTVGKHAVVFALNANSLNMASSFVGLMHSFAGMGHNKDTTGNIHRISRSLDIMGIVLDFLL